MIVTLPWPDKRLSPNARLNWRAKVGPKQSAKIAAGWLTYAASRGLHDAMDALRASDGPIPVRITFYPPDKRHRDDDNMIASFKASRDGIADAMGVNDRRFRPQYVFAEPEKPGRVEVDFPGIIPMIESQGQNERFLETPDSATQKNGPSGATTPPSRDHDADTGATR